MILVVNGQSENAPKEQGNFDKLVRRLLLDKTLSMLGIVGLALHLLLRYLYLEVERIDDENPHEVRKRLLSLPQSGEAGQMLQKLEQMRTHVLHAFNVLEGVQKGRESFGIRLKRMKRQGKIPDEVFEQILVLSRYRNRAVYESYHLTEDELKAADEAFDKVGAWTLKVGYVY